MTTKYLRQLSKPTHVSKIANSPCVARIELDVITNEFRSRNNKLSFWKYDDEEQMNEAIKAIIFSGGNLKALKLLILDEEVLKRIGTEAISTTGETAYINGQELHVDIEIQDYQILGLMLKELILHLKDTNSSCDISRYRVDQLVKASFIEKTIDADIVDTKKGLKASLASLYSDGFNGDHYYNELINKIKLEVMNN